MAMIQFLRGSQAGLAAKETINGALYFTTDTHKIYMGTETGKQEFSAIEVVSAVSALPSVATAIKGKFYYAEAENVFCFPYNGEWKQVNPDTGATSIEVVDGGGNAISAASYDASTRKITLTKGVTFATPAVVDSKISDKVGELKIGDNTYDTVKAYVDQKTSGIATDASLSALTNRVTTAEGEIDALQAAIGEGGSVTNAIADAKKAGTDAKAAADAAQADVNALSDKVGTVTDGKTVVALISEAKTQADKGVADAAAAKSAADAAQATADTKTTMAEVEAKNYATKTEAKGYADAKDTAIAAAQDAADAAQTAVDTLKGKVGTVPENKTVVQMIDEAQAAATYDDTEVRSLISDNKNAIEAHKTAIDAKVTTLIGEDSDKSVRTIASEETAKIVAGADASFDTLKEIADWISSHKTDAAAMNSAIVALEGIVDGIGGEGEKATVVAYVTDAIAALKIGDYAKAVDLTALAARVEALETTVGKAAEGENPATGLIKDIADNKTTIAAEKSRAEGAESALSGRIDTLEAIDHDAYALKTAVADDKAKLEGKINANTSAIEILNGAENVEGSVAKKIKDAIAAENLSQYATDAELSALDARVVTVEGKAHTHDNKAELDKIKTGDKAKWDAVVEDHLVAADKTALENAIATKANSADVYTKTEVDTKLTDALSWGEF